MTATITNSTPVLDKKGLHDVIDRMRDVQTEGDRWELAESLKVLIPTGSNGFAAIIDEATDEGVVGNLSANTLRLYRDTANRWPASKRVPNVSFSAHREAMVLPNIDSAVKMLNDLVKTQGAGKVSVASVRKAVAIKQGKQPKAKAGTTQTSASGPNAAATLVDLEKANGSELIKSIGNESDAAKLDAYHASLTKVLAHVEKLRAKAARAAKPAAKASDKSAADKPAPKPAAKTGEKAGDMRGL